MNISQMNSIQHNQYLVERARDGQAKKYEKSLRIAGHFRRKTSLIVAGVMVFSQMASAAVPQEFDVFNGMQEVSDSDLGHMRGKFASNNQVMFFGVEMVSQWQTAMGELITAGANLNIDLRGATPTVQYMPTVTIVQQGQGALAPVNGNTNGVSGGAGLSNVSGVSQSIQVAGQSNRIVNGIDMQVDISSGQGGSLAGAMQGQSGALSATGNDGTVATVTLANNSVGVSVNVPGQGQVLQQIRNQGMFQSARIGGDLNQIHNAITMHIGLNSGGGASLDGAHAALQSLKNLPQNGLF